MKRNWKLVCTVIMIAVVGLFWACGDDSPTSPSATPAPAPQFTTSSNSNPTPTPTPPASPTNTDIPDIKPKRGNNPFGSGYACEDYPVGIGMKPVWRENEQGRISEWTIWTINNTTDQRWRVSGKVFGEKEPGCVDTVRGRKGADDILIIEDPEWIEVGEKRNVRWRIDMNPMYNEDYLCGRFQFGIGLKPETHGDFWNHTDRVIDTGSYECDPPKKECDDQSTNLTLAFDNPSNQSTTTTSSVYGVRATVNSTQPGVFTLTGQSPKNYPEGQWSKLYGPYRCGTGTLVGTADSECNDDTKNIKIPDCECSPCQNEVKASINIREERRGNIVVSGNAPYPGVVTMPDGSTTNVRKGRFSLNAGTAECEETYTASIKAYDDKCGGEPVLCSQASDSYTAEDCSCNTCQHTGLRVSKSGRGNGIQVGNPPSGTYYTVGDDPTPHYSSGNYGPYEPECEETITVVVKLYDESCGEPAVFCRDWSITFTGRCLCEGVDLSGSSSIDGNNLVTASVNDAPGSSATHYKYKRHNMGSASTTTMPWGESFQLSCDGSYQVTVRAYDGEKQCDEKVLTEDASGCNQCVLPGSGSGNLDLPNSNPTTECGYFNLIPGDGGFYITKCGQFYQWGTSHPSPGGQCTNGQDVSHITECECPPDPS